MPFRHVLQSVAITAVATAVTSSTLAGAVRQGGLRHGSGIMDRMSQRRASTTPRSSLWQPSRPERLALMVLAALACVLAHEATYLVAFGGGAPFATAMRTSGHDGYWLWLVGAVGLATLALAAATVRQLLRLHREAGALPADDRGLGLRSYLTLTLAAWARLALLAGMLYTLQENAEALAAGLPIQGLDVVLRHGCLPLALILIATLVVALVAALVHWRRLVLLGRLAAGPRTWSRARSSVRSATTTLPLRSRVPASNGSRAPPARHWSLPTAA